MRTFIENEYRRIFKRVNFLEKENEELRRLLEVKDNQLKRMRDAAKDEIKEQGEFYAGMIK